MYVKFHVYYSNYLCHLNSFFWTQNPFVSCLPSLKVKPGGTRCIVIQNTADDVFKQAKEQQFLISKNYLSQRCLFLSSCY